jgi:ATP-binding cassette subfamily B protein/ATP-binding cassette subfamily C protein/ATP-binding cassette subfamily B multidrug efflux pump
VSFAYPSVRPAADGTGDGSDQSRAAEVAQAAEATARPADTAFGFTSAPTPTDAAVRATPGGGPVPALSEVSVEIAPGSTLGVVGPTGAGKTTLLSLLLRHYAPDTGSVCWGAHRLADYRLAALRGAIAWVPQEAFLFSASIADNIALSRPQATRAEVEQAAQLAALHEDVLRFPQGYDTQVGEKGVTLSGGQRQRVAIARALLAQAGEDVADDSAEHPANDPAAAPPLLLLDDALSAVDTGTETTILAHLRGTLAGAAAQRGRRTAVIVSHRLSAVVDADQIVVLKDGRIVERGTHEQLVQLGGWYAAQWRYQQLEASLDAA